MEKAIGLRKRTGIIDRRNACIGLAFALPYYVLFLIFTIIPVGVSLFFSLTDFNMLEVPHFVGLDNYTRLFLEDAIFRKAIGNTLVLALVIGPGGYLLSLMFAWFINELRPVMRAFLTVIFYAPSLTGNATLIWNLLFSGDSYGYLNGILMQLNIISRPIVWLKTPEYIIPIVCIVSLWGSFGTGFLTFVAGFQGVDKSYYEAAAIDGIRNRWQELWFVTLPLMRPQMMFSALMSITGALGVGAVVTSLCGYPTVNYVGQTIATHLSDYGGARYEMGYASAIAVVLCVLMVGTNTLIQKMIQKVGS